MFSMQYALLPSEKFIPVSDDRLIVSGRIIAAPGVRRMIFPYSSVTFRFFSPFVKVIVRNFLSSGETRESSLGAVLDRDEKGQRKFILSPDGREEVISLAEGLDGGEHLITLFKRTDCVNETEILGFVIAESGAVLPGVKVPRRKILFYGDSVTAGEVSEAVHYMAQPDPPHHGEYNNSWYSYAAILSRAMNAEAHICAQGGIALLPGMGYYQPSLSEVWDKNRFDPRQGELSDYDFTAYTPHLIVAAIGQNDDYPENYMKLDPRGVQARIWKEAYADWIRSIRSRYPNAWIVLATTILNHSPQWDRAIGSVTATLQSEGDKRVFHMLYGKNGRGTPGHVRIHEAEEMAIELRTFINSMGDVWNS